MVSALVVALAGLSSPGHAMGGPWTVAPGRNDFYLGAFYEHWGLYSDGQGKRHFVGTEQNPVSISFVGGKAIWTRGVVRDVEFEVDVPFEQATASDFGGSEFFRTVTNVADVKARLKYRYLDESKDAPLSASVALISRLGYAHSETRDRLTTIGKGTNDVGVAASFGRVALTPYGTVTVHTDGRYWYRPEVTTFEDGAKLPYDDVGAEIAAYFGPHPRFALGAVFDGIWALGGLNMEDVPNFVGGDNTWIQLHSSQVKAGGKFMLFQHGRMPNIVVGYMRTVHSLNSADDSYVIDAGIGLAFGP